MNTKQLWAGVVASMLGVAGCGDDAASNGFDVLSAAESDAIGVLCECFTVLEFASAAECQTEFGEDRTPAEVACIQDVYATNAAALQPETDCLVEAFGDAESCFNAVNACDPTAHSACLDAAIEASEACPDSPDAVDAALEACDPPPPV